MYMYIICPPRLVSNQVQLPHAPVVKHEEALGFIAAHDLHRRGLGWIEVPLLASARLAGQAVWTLERQLAIADSGALALCNHKAVLETHPHGPNTGGYNHSRSIVSDYHNTLIYH